MKLKNIFATLLVVGFLALIALIFVPHFQRGRHADLLSNELGVRINARQLSNISWGGDGSFQYSSGDPQGQPFRQVYLKNWKIVKEEYGN